MKDLIIRRAKEEDIIMLRKIEQDLIKVERSFDNKIKDEPLTYYDLNGMILSPNVYLIVAEINHNIIATGYAFIIPSKPHLKHPIQAHLGFMYVSPIHRGKKIIQKIIKELKKWCLEKKILELRLEVYGNNQSAIKAYESCGFINYIMEMRLDASLDVD
jgi:GNAT superfamily N-acetyltransferase